MRILFFLSYYKPYIGGAENAFIRLAEGLAKRQHDVTVITSRIPGTSPVEVINGVRVERVDVPKWADRYFFPFMGCLRVLQRAKQADIIHTASNCITIPAYIASRIHHRPIVFTSLEVVGKRWSMLCRPTWLSWFYQWIEKIIARRKYDRYATISEATRNDLADIGVDRVNVSVIYCGVDEEAPKQQPPAGYVQDGTLRELCHIPGDGFLYVYFGRPGPTKGVDHLVRAAAQINRQIPNSHLALILGQKPQGQYQSICQLIQELDVSSTVHLIPSVPDRVQLFKMLLEANCVVVPSVTEGFGLTTAEACALGIPVVATRAGSIPEVISGKHILVEPGQSAELVKGVIKAANGDYDWTPPKQFLWDTMVSAYEQLYTQVFEAHAQHNPILQNSSEAT